MTKNEIVHYAGYAQSDLASFKVGGVVRQGKGDRINIKMPNGQLITIPSPETSR